VAPKTNPEGPVVQEERTQEMKEVGVMRLQQHSPSRIGREPEFVETVGLGNLRVISANGLKE
tara:strand:- start:764 stop:949 length:186 start_codon:yes stop_codon:yes gene_type:complete